MSTGRPQLASHVRLDPWKQATNRFFASLSEDERKVFDTASLADLESLFYKSSNVERAYQTGKLQKVAQPLMDVLKQYKDVLDTFSDCNELLKPIWGSVLVVLTIASAYGDFFDRLTSMFGKIGQALPNLRDYEQLFQNDQRLMNHLTNAYFVILEFCIEVKTVFEKKQSEDKAWALRHPTMSKMREKTLVNWAVTVNAMSPVSSSKWDDFMKRLQQEEKAAKTRTSIIHQEEQKKHREMTLRREQEDRRRRLLSLLVEVDIIAKHDSTSRRRQTDTATWIFDNDKFKSLMRSSQTECLCCYGIVGSGKTFISSSVIDYLTEQHGRTEFVSYHYFDHADKRSLSFLSCLAAFMRQLLLRKGWSVLVEHALSEILDQGSLSISEAALADLILSAWSESCPALFLVIDGIDELPGVEQQKLVTYITKLNTYTGIVCKSFITCRLGEGRLDEQLARVQTFSLVVGAQNVAPDIHKIVSQSLDAWQPALSQDDMTALKTEISRVLTTQGAEMFLLVTYQLEELMAAVSIEEMEVILTNLPRTVTEAYDRALLRKVGNKDATFTIHLATQAFKWLCCAKRPLRLVELMEAVILEPEDESFPKDRVMLAGAGEARLLDACGNLIVHDKVTDLVTLAHSTVRQYLLDSHDYKSGSTIRISQVEAESHICELCMVYLNLKEFDGTIVKSQAPLIVKSNAIPGADKVYTASGVFLRMSKGHFQSSSSKPVSVDLRGALRRANKAGAVDAEAFHLLDYVQKWWIEHVRVLDEVGLGNDFGGAGRDIHSDKLWASFEYVVYDRQCTLQFRPWNQANKTTLRVNTFEWALENAHLPLLSLSVKGFNRPDLECTEDSLRRLPADILQPVLLAMGSKDANLAKSIFIKGLLRPHPEQRISRQECLIIEATENMDHALNFPNTLTAVQALMGTQYCGYAAAALPVLTANKKFEAVHSILISVMNEPLHTLTPYMPFFESSLASGIDELRSIIVTFFRDRAVHGNETYEILTWLGITAGKGPESIIRIVHLIRDCDPLINEFIRYVSEQCKTNDIDRLCKTLLFEAPCWQRIGESRNAMIPLADWMTEAFGMHLSEDLDTDDPASVILRMDVSDRAEPYLRQLLQAHGVSTDLRTIKQLLSDLPNLPPQPQGDISSNMRKLLLRTPLICTVSHIFIVGVKAKREQPLPKKRTSLFHRTPHTLPVSFAERDAQLTPYDLSDTSFIDRIDEALSWGAPDFETEDSDASPTVLSMMTACELLLILKLVLPGYISNGDEPWQQVWQKLNPAKPLHEQYFYTPSKTSRIWRNRRAFSPETPHPLVEPTQNELSNLSNRLNQALQKRKEATVLLQASSTGDFVERELDRPDPPAYESHTMLDSGVGDERQQNYDDSDSDAELNEAIRLSLLDATLSN